jgi:hypothetical protein
MNSKILICNDFVCGIGGEEVMWNFLCDQIDGAIGLDSRTVNCSNQHLAHLLDECIKQEHSDGRIIIQNATFMGFIDMDKHRRTIVYLQDNLRLMNRIDPQQEQNLHLADVRVCNSRLTAMSYPEYKFEIIPIGVNEVLFCPTPFKKAMRGKYNLTLTGKIGIFVGALNNVKGWKEVHRIIENHPEIFFLIVSKHADESHNTPNSLTFNQINQKNLAELLQCSDFFILGSPVETQCLAAIEACLCGVPVIMKPTGIFMDFSVEDRAKCGFFGENLETFIDPMFEKLSNPEKTLFPRETVLKNDLSINGMITKWKRLIENINEC